MDENEILDQLIFCSLCYFPHKNKTRGSSFLISYCMHIVCTSCLDSPRLCPVCNSQTTFVQVSESISHKLKKNVSELFIRPVDLSMFQISSAVNLISFLTEQVSSHKRLLLMAKNEIKKLKRQPYEEKHQRKKHPIEKKTTILNFSNISTSSTTNRISLPKNFKPYRKYFYK